MGRKKQKRDRPEDRIFCWYCEKTFTDEHVLANHQKEKHLKCPFCRKRLQSLNGLHIHCSSVHKETIASVPNAIEGRNSFDYDVFGMEGIPDWYWQSLFQNGQQPPTQPANLYSQAPQMTSAMQYPQSYYQAYSAPQQVPNANPYAQVPPGVTQPPPNTYPPVGSYPQPHLQSAPLVSQPRQEPTNQPSVTAAAAETTVPNTASVERVSSAAPSSAVQPNPAAMAGKQNQMGSSALVFSHTDVSPSGGFMGSTGRATCEAPKTESPRADGTCQVAERLSITRGISV